MCFGGGGVGGYLMVLASPQGFPKAWHRPSLLLEPLVFPVTSVSSPAVSRLKPAVHLEPTGVTEGTKLRCFDLPTQPPLWGVPRAQTEGS